MSILTRSRKAVIVATSTILISMASVTGCGIIDIYTGPATVVSHAKAAKYCNAVITREDGKTLDVNLGLSNVCDTITDGQTIRFYNGGYRRH